MFWNRILECVQDMPADGHCGFHAVAFHLGAGSDSSWASIRKDLLQCFLHQKAFWLSLLGEEANMLENQLYWQGSGSAPPANWYSSPECTILTATLYARPVVVLTDKGHATTFLPYTTEAGGKEMVLLHINGNHWQVGELLTGSAWPLIDAIWKHHSSIAQRHFWMSQIQNQVDRWPCV